MENVYDKKFIGDNKITEEFKTRVTETHGNSEYGKEYKRFITAVTKYLSGR
jgi:hypothetical protein